MKPPLQLLAVNKSGNNNHGLPNMKEDWLEDQMVFGKPRNASSPVTYAETRSFDSHLQDPSDSPAVIKVSSTTSTHQSLSNSFNSTSQSLCNSYNSTSQTPNNQYEKCETSIHSVNATSPSSVLREKILHQRKGHLQAWKDVSLSHEVKLYSLWSVCHGGWINYEFGALN